LKYFLYIILLSLLLSSVGCSPKLSGNAPLLYSQAVSGNKLISSERLEALLPQKPNRKILKLPFTPWVSLYQSQLHKIPKWEKQIVEIDSVFLVKTKSIDSNSQDYKKLFAKKEKKIRKLNQKLTDGNFRMKLGELPVYFYERDAQNNVEKMRLFLRNRGFFNAKVSYKTRPQLSFSSISKKFFSKKKENYSNDTSIVNSKNVIVTYIVNEGNGYAISKNDSVVIADRTIREILKTHQDKSLLKINEYFDVDNQNAEKVRIEKLLKDNGYFLFTKDAIRILVDDRDTTKRHSVKIITNIPSKDYGIKKPLYNKIFPLNTVRMVIDGSSPMIDSPVVDTVKTNGVEYIFVNKKYSTKLLDTKISIRPDGVYSSQKVTDTQKRLYNLDQFKFTNVNFDTTKGVLNTTIYTVPLDKYNLGIEAGASVFQFVPGPFANFSLKVRNILGGLESLETNIRAGYEAQLGFLQTNTNTVRQNLDLSFSTSLIFPQMLIPRKWASVFENYTPKSQIGLGISYVDRQEFKLLNFRSSLTYSWKLSNYQSFSISLLDLNLIQTPDKTNDFNTYLDNQRKLGNNIFINFNPSFVSSVSGWYIYDDNILRQNKTSKYFRILLESGGTTLNFIPNNRIGFLDKIFVGNIDSLQFYRFLKFNVDYRIYRSISKNSMFALRFNTGIAYAYDKNGVLPYEKNFFVGGPNSIRAWRPRRLGAGSFSGNTDNKFEQPGSVLFEASAEYRFKIFHFLGDFNGALFVDAGNVWTLKNQGGTDFGSTDFAVDKFLGEIAIGTGMGLRLDFKYFVIRLDGGVKVIDPSNPKGQRYVLNKFNPYRSGTPAQIPYLPVLNIGIGYPF
jgi:outer membrane protein assembly factor BamA